VQPSEFVKLAVIVILARYYSKNAYTRGFTLRELISPLVLVLVPAVLIVKQPDLGTALMFVFVFTAMVLVAGVRGRVLAALILIAAISIGLFSQIFFERLRPYQRHRIEAFLNPEADPSGIGYQIMQSKITVGSGGLLGKGYLGGTQAPLRFLPERHTDFAFSIFAEEWGFAGSFVLLALYLLWILRMLEAAQKAKDSFGYYLVTGLTTMTFFYVFINVAMTMGLLPVVGVPMPLMSYGGTALVSNFLVVGLIANVRMRRYELFD